MERYRRNVSLRVLMALLLICTGALVVGASAEAKDLDAVFANGSEPSQACLGDGTGEFDCSEFPFQPTFEIHDVALGDTNGNGRLDAIFASFGSLPNQLCLNQGGTPPDFTCSQLASDRTSSDGVALRDMHGDNRIDAVFTDADNPNQICLNQGSGSFNCSDISTHDDVTQGLAVGDVNGDDRPDLVFANGNSLNGDNLNRLCLNQGGSPLSFDCEAVSPDGYDSYDVRLADLDGDSDLDAVFANRSAPNRFCLWDSRAHGFQCADVAGAANRSAGVALGDLNGDDRPEIVFANRDEPNRVCRPEGLPLYYRCVDVSAQSGSSRDVALGDVNGDGTLDAIFADAHGPRICLNQGGSSFNANCTGLSGDVDNTVGVALGEIGEAAAPPQPGEDSRVNIIDARICLQIAQGVISGTADQRARCDVDGNGQVTQSDAAEIGKHEIGLPSDLAATEFGAPLALGLIVLISLRKRKRRLQSIGNAPTRRRDRGRSACGAEMR